MQTGALWRHFHDLDRPTGPDDRLAIEVLAEAGITVSVEHFERPPRPLPREVRVAQARRLLCLPASRDAEIDAMLGPETALPARRVTTVWWDVA